jgi:putative aldouronate transport system permease protein
MERNRMKRPAVGASLGMALVSLVIVLPILAVASISLTREPVIYERGFSLLPPSLDLSSYSYVLTASGAILSSYGMTILVTLLGTAISIVLTVLLAYPLTVESFFLRKRLNRLLVVTILFNGGMVPTYIVMTRILHLGNTIWGHVMPFALFPFYVVLLRTYFQGVPKELRESAYIDGAGELAILLRVILPLSTPAIASVVLLTGLRIWNDTWYTGMLYMTGNAYRTLPMYLQQMMENIKVMTRMAAMLGRDIGEVPKESARMAMCVIAFGPLVLVFPFFQRYFAKGATLGAIKG